MRRGALRYVQLDRQLRTLLVPRPPPADGKTTVARHLAVGGGDSGSTFLLLRPIFRHPSLAEQFDIALGRCSDVLDRVVRCGEPPTVRLDQPPQCGSSRARLLVAGGVAASNPRVMKSDAMAGVIEQ